MPFPSAPARILGLVLAGSLLAHSASDPRSVLCDRPTTLALTGANGTIDIKNPLASGTLKTLYKVGDQYQLQGGQKYVLFLNESSMGFFSFNLQWTSGDPAAPNQWSCRIRTIDKPPFIVVDQQSWTGRPGNVTINPDPTQLFIRLD